MRVPEVLAHVDGEAVSAHLPPLLAAVYVEVLRPRPDLPALKTALRALLDFLALPAGRTNANCYAADAFFLHNDRWAGDWEHLPDA